jgi:hypothetical protein
MEKVRSTLIVVVVLVLLALAALAIGWWVVEINTNMVGEPDYGEVTEDDSGEELLEDEPEDDSVLEPMAERDTLDDMVVADETPEIELPSVPTGDDSDDDEGEAVEDPSRPVIDCDSKVDLHTYYEEEGFGTNDCGDFGQIEITEWNDDGTGTGVDWNGREVEFY